MVQRETRYPTNRPVRPLAEQSRRHRPKERYHHRHLHLQTKGAALSAVLRLLRLPAGRRQMISKRSIGRTFQPKTNKRSLHGLTSFSLVTWMDPYLLPPHPLYPSPQTVQVITHPRRHRDPRHRFLIIGLIPDRVKMRAPILKTTQPQHRPPQQQAGGIFLPCCPNKDPQRSSILQNHLHLQKYQKRFYQMHPTGLHIPHPRIRPPIFRCPFPHPRPMAPPPPT